MSKVYITDTSLRDGSHSVSHQYTSADVAKVAAALDEAGVDIIEVNHGDGLGGASITYGFSLENELDLVEAAAKAVKNAKIAVLLVPGIATLDLLEEAQRRGATIVRVATHVTEADVSEEYIKAAKKMGMFIVGFLMMAHMADTAKLVEQALIMESYGADVVYATDSAGALLPDEVGERVAAMKAALKVPVGHHAHDNLGCAVANSLAAVKAGATYIDGSLGGMGAGAGNSATEMLVGALKKSGADVAADLFKTMDAAEKVLLPLVVEKGKPLPRHDSNSLIMGYAGVYSSFMLHARKGAERFGVDVRDILIELGKRKAVGGQEDWIIQVAYDLAKAAGRQV
ncbi:MAG: 4-hydroxy-2-oxovalerate aldolase [Spirochaetae bacterium HGW-Spirochaetae-9]|nr:MAG: 4-hydroxy-2-oxovalerate aldolase [Spirochaetae bacterium HGW-Spirochaetae-9]